MENCRLRKAMSARSFVLLLVVLVTIYIEHSSAFEWVKDPGTEIKRTYPNQKTLVLRWEWKLSGGENVALARIVRYKTKDKDNTKTVIGTVYASGTITTDNAYFNLTGKVGTSGGSDGYVELTINDINNQGNNKDNSKVDVFVSHFTYDLDVTVEAVQNPYSKSTKLMVYSAFKWVKDPGAEIKLTYPNQKTLVLRWEWRLSVGENVALARIERYKTTDKENTKTVGGTVYASGTITTDNAYFNLTGKIGTSGGSNGYMELTIYDINNQGNNKDGSKVDVTVTDYTYECDVSVETENEPYINSTKLIVYVLPGKPVLQLQPDNPVFCQGDTINITCNGVTGNPTLTNLAFLQNDSSIGMLNVTTSGNYTKAVLSHVLTQPGTLKFSCNATNAAGSSPTSNVVTITVKDPPVITSCTNKTAVEKGNLLWSCDVSGSQPLNISWFKGNTNTVIQSGKSLNITTVTKNDSGMYRFTASNGGKCPTGSKTVYLDVQYKPRNVQVVPSSVPALNINGSFSLTCNASSNLDGSYTWSLNGVTLVGKTNRMLTKDNITPHDAGEYTCTVTNSVGIGTSNKVTINVNYIGVATCNAKPNPIKENENFALICSAAGYPPVNYTWTLPGSDVYQQNTTVRAHTSLNGVSMTCKAMNSRGIKTCTKTITVHYKPRNVQVVPASVPALDINGSFSLTCNASANPDGSFTWSLNGVTLVGKTNRVLTKDNIKLQNAGEYICSVKNSEGIGTSNKVTINVNYKPKMQKCDPVLYLSENTNHVFHCNKADGFPAPSYTALYNGNNYNASVTIVRVTKALNGSVIRCSASNSLGSDSCHTTLIVTFTEYVYKGSFRITNSLYQNILNDRSSLEFKILKAYIENMLKSVYTPYKYVTSAEVIGFWPGSVVVGFQLKLIANISDPLSPIKEALIKNGSSLDGLKIDPTSIQLGEYVHPTTMKTTKATTLQPSITPCLCTEYTQVPAIVLGVLFAIALVINIILVGYIIWKHRIEINARPKSSSNNNEEAIYMNNIALQDEVPSNVPQYASVGNQEQHQPTTQMYQSLQTQTLSDTYSSLSPNTKLPPKPAVITNSGVYQDLQGASRPQYQSLDNFSRV